MAKSQHNHSREVPHFRYYHLAAWIVAATLLLLFHKWQLRSWNMSRILGQVEVQDTAWQLIQRTVTDIAVGGQLMLIAFGVAWRLRGVAVPNQPGHWLAILQTAAYACLMASQAWRFRIEGESDATVMNELASKAILFMLGWAGGIGLISLFLAWARTEDKQWRIVYVLVALLMGIVALPAIGFIFPAVDQGGLILGIISPLNFQRYVPLIVSASMLAAILNCAAMDVVQERRRDWAHWFGVSLYSLALGLAVASYVAT